MGLATSTRSMPAWFNDSRPAHILPSTTCGPEISDGGADSSACLRWAPTPHDIFASRERIVSIAFAPEACPSSPGARLSQELRWPGLKIPTTRFYVRSIQVPGGTAQHGMSDPRSGYCATLYPASFACPCRSPEEPRYRRTHGRPGDIRTHLQVFKPVLGRNCRQHRATGATYYSNPFLSIS